jgi:16S rRNA (uracil1498-N3)-methyltransferase
VVERARRAPVGTFYAPGDWRGGERVELDAAAAHHASVKRIVAGDVVRLTNGAGRRAEGIIESVSKRSCVISLASEAIEEVDPLTHVELWAPVGDRDRMLMLAEKSVELGLSSWRPIVYARSRSVSPRGEGEGFHEKLRLRQISALEQSGGAWLPDAYAEVLLDDALAATSSSAPSTRVVLDVDGESIGSIADELRGGVALALGPEGGLEEHERATFITHGWRPVSLGRNVLRFETAGIAALAILRALTPNAQ